MTDTRTTKEKLEAEAETQARVQSEAARAFLAGKLEQWKQDHANGASPAELVRAMAKSIVEALQAGHVPLADAAAAPAAEAVVDALELLDQIIAR